MATKRGNRWQVSFRDNGKLIRPTFSTEVEANSWLVLATDARARGVPLPALKSAKDKSIAHLEPFINSVYHELWGGNKSQRQYKQYVAELIAYYGPNKDVSSFTTAEIDRFLTACTLKGNSDKTLNRKIAVLSKLLKKAVALDMLHRLPGMSRRKEGQGRKRYLMPNEEQQVVSTLWKLGHEQASKRCVFMIYTGARDGEVRHLQWNDIHGKNITLDGKTGHRTLVIPEKAAEALRWCRAQGYTKPFPMSYESFKEAWDEVAIKLGKDEEPGWVPYAMRHTCASRLVQRGVDIRRVRDWMGHSTIQTTMTYAHLAPDDLEQCADALNAA